MATAEKAGEQATGKVFWTDVERQKLLDRGLQIAAKGINRNPTSILGMAQKEVLPSHRRRKVMTTRSSPLGWFHIPISAEIEKRVRGMSEANGHADVIPPAAEATGFAAPAMPPAVAETEADPAPTWTDEPLCEEADAVTMDQLMMLDPRMLLQALEQHCLTRLDAFAGMLLDMEKMFSRMSSVRSLDPLASSRIEPRRAVATPNLRRLVHAPRTLQGQEDE